MLAKMLAEATGIVSLNHFFTFENVLVSTRLIIQKTVTMDKEINSITFEEAILFMNHPFLPMVKSNQKTARTVLNAVESFQTAPIKATHAFLGTIQN